MGALHKAGFTNRKNKMSTNNFVRTHFPYCRAAT